MTRKPTKESVLAFQNRFDAIKRKNAILASRNQNMKMPSPDEIEFGHFGAFLYVESYEDGQNSNEQETEQII